MLEMLKVVIVTIGFLIGGDELGEEAGAGLEV